MTNQRRKQTVNNLNKKLDQKHAIMDAYAELITKIIMEGSKMDVSEYKKCYQKLDEILKIKYK